MADESLVKRIAYEYPYFESYLEPKGALKIDKECHACFYYGMLAHKAIAMIGDSNESQVIVYKVGDTPPPWMEANLGNIARGVAMMYALESPDKFLPFKKEAWAQAKMLGVEIPAYVFNVAPDTVIKH
jgi:hypothetical protein